MNLYPKTETDSDEENRLVAKEGGCKEGRSGTLELADAKYYI